MYETWNHKHKLTHMYNDTYTHTCKYHLVTWSRLVENDFW